MGRPTAGRLGALAAMLLLCAIALQTAGRISAEAGATEVINVVAVGANGQPINGYHVINRPVSPNLDGVQRPFTGGRR